MPTSLTVPRRLGLLALALVGAGTALGLSLHEEPGPRQPLAVPVLLLLVAMLVVELGRMHLEVRRSALTVTLSDVAVVVAVFAVPPGETVLLRVVACAPVLVWLYGRSATKLAVNAGVLLLETAVLVGMVHLLTDRPDPSSWRSWVAVLVAVQASGLLCGLAVDVAIVVSGETLERTDVVEGLLVGASVSAVTAVLGLLAVTVLHSSRTGWVLLLLVLLLAMTAYRGYARMRERKDALEAVHAFTRSLAGEEDPEALLRAMLSHVPRLLSAERVFVVLLEGHEPGGTTLVEAAGEDLCRRSSPRLSSLVRRVIDTGEPALVQRGARGTLQRDGLAQHGARELMASPLSADGGVVGVVVALDRMGQSRGFRSGDLVLFETLTSHAAVALANAQLVAHLRRAADTDILTGLPNRRGLAAAVGALVGPAALVVLDLNGFTEVNEALGHHAGDALLRATGRRIAEGVRAGTVVARLDGDEFAVLLPGAGAEEASEVAERLLGRIAEAVDLESVPVALDAAAGISTSAMAEDLIRAAEIALRVTRRRGGMLVYDVGMDPPSAHRLALAAELRRVLAEPSLSDQVVPYFQPKARLADGAVLSVEALVRWHHPERGLVPPDAFIPVVESTDLVRPLTLHVLDRSLQQAARWAAAGRPLVVAVNLSARNLLDHRLEDDVRGLLARHHVPPSLLSLEITESAVMDDPERAQIVLQALAGLGVQLSVDDFGTGYSSLAYLARLPVSEVKVDRAFVSRMTTQPRDAAVVRSVVELGHSLGLCVVAEGVEDQDCYDALATMGCDVAQGYLLSRPVPADALDRWLAGRSQAAQAVELVAGRTA